MPPKPPSSHHSANLRAELERYKNDALATDQNLMRQRRQQQQQEPDAATATGGEFSQRMKERQDRINDMKLRAAKEAHNLNNSSSDSKRSSRRFRCAIIALVVAVLVGLAVILASKTPGFAIRDAICSVQRLVQGKGAREIALYEKAIGDAYQANVHSVEHNRTLFWGTYRPNVLAGVKSREEKPLLFGIAFWDGNRHFPVRHTAEDGEAVLFRWDVHDGRWYGREFIEDRQLGMRLRVRFAKKAPGRDGWVVSIQSQRYFFRPLSFALYFASEFEGSNFHVRSRFVQPSKVAAPGLSEGAFSTDSKLIVSGNLQTTPTAAENTKNRNNQDENSNKLMNTRFLATIEDDAGSAQESQWQAFALKAKSRTEAWNIDFHNGLRGSARIAEHLLFARGSGAKSDFKAATTSLVFVKKISGDFRFTVTLTEQDGVEDQFSFQDQCTNEAIFSYLEDNFRQRFDEVFNIGAHLKTLRQMWPSEFAGISHGSFINMCESALSNLLGGMGYWHGDYRVQKSKKVVETHGPKTLFSGVPSRAKFPRGFLWDEGFHQLLVHHWDRALSEDVLLHWLSLMEPNGWIPREQILGLEARTRVPDEFVAQHPEHTNPPAMILVLQGMLLDHNSHAVPSSSNSKDASADEVDTLAEDSTFAQKVLPLLGRWFKFVIESQCGGDPKTCPSNAATLKHMNAHELAADNTSFLFRWRSRNGYHLLASGLDDYPRPHCAVAEELHVDLYCWAHMMSRAVRMMSQATMATTTASLNSVAAATLKEISQLPQLRVPDDAWRKWLIKLHWSEQFKHFSDQKGCANQLQRPQKQQQAENSLIHSPFFGYVNLWPILTLSLEAEERDYILETLLKARHELSSGKGLQSLSNRSRRLLDKHDDYWTGPIWINVNFLFLRALHRKYIAIIGDEAVQIYNEVRRDVLQNVGRQFVETGKLWENYCQKTGKGRGTAPFTGWTALVVLIAAEKY